MTEDDEAPAGPDSSPAEWQVNVIIALAVLALLHTFLIAVWIAPASRARDSLGGSSLTGYVNPYFTQAWSTLTPSSQQVDEAFLVRARIASTGKPRSEERRVGKGRRCRGGGDAEREVSAAPRGGADS